MPLIALALVPLLGASALAQDIPWKDLAPGDRVEIGFRSGATFIGSLVAPPRAPSETAAVDFSKLASITLDVTWEYPGLNGTLSVPKQDIRSLRVLRALDEKTRARIADLKQQLANQNAAAKPVATPAPLVQDPPAPAPDPDEAAKKEREELQKAKEIFAKFPPPDWGPERRASIRLKRARGQQPTLPERDFEEGYTLWEKGRAAAEKKN